MDNLNALIELSVEDAIRKDFLPFIIKCLKIQVSIFIAAKRIRSNNVWANTLSIGSAVAFQITGSIIFGVKTFSSFRSNWFDITKYTSTSCRSW